MGVMCRDVTQLESWQLACLDQIAALGFVTQALVILDANNKEKSILDRVRNLGFRRIVFVAMYKYFFRAKARKTADASRILGDADVLLCRTELRGKYSEYFCDDDVEAIRDQNLDIIIRFDFGIIRGDILKSARYGVWSFHHDDEMKYRGDPPCYWEIAKDDPVTGFILQRLTDRLDGGTVLRKGFIRTQSHSYNRNLSAALFESAKFPALVCIDIQNRNTDYFDRHPSVTDAPIFKCPSILEQTRVLGKMLLAWIKRLWIALFQHEQWTLGIVDKPIQEFLTDSTHNANYLSTFNRSRFLADGFGLAHGNELVVLCEDYSYKSDIGDICWLKIDRKGELLVGPQPAFDLTTHASYPYIFEDNDEIFCVPETCRAKDTTIWRSVTFPGTWEKVATILEGKTVVDPTVFRHGDYWWIFFTMKESKETGASTNLYAWYSTQLDGLWAPHALNPIKTDVRSARPAGTPFFHEDKLFRPAQDCSRTYGGRVTINRVDRLTPTEFDEDEVIVLNPDRSSQYPHGMHTLVSMGDVTLIDAKRHIFIPSALNREVRYLFRHLFG
jgi:hypothetical protein